MIITITVLYYCVFIYSYMYVFVCTYIYTKPYVSYRKSAASVGVGKSVKSWHDNMSS